MVARCLAMIAMGFALAIFPATARCSPETSEVWKGTDSEILEQALSRMTGPGRAEMAAQFADEKSELSLEMKLWVIIDHLRADSDTDHQPWLVKSLFSTLRSDGVFSHYSLERTRSLLLETVEALPEILAPIDPAAAAKEGAVYVIDEFTGERRQTTQRAVDRERRIRFLHWMLEGSLNVLLVKSGQSEDRELILTVAEAGDDEIKMLANEFARLLAERWEREQPTNSSKPKE